MRYLWLFLQKGEAVANAAAEQQRKAAEGKKGPAVRGTLFYKVTVKVLHCCCGQIRVIAAA